MEIIENVIRQIESQASHIMRNYEDEELEEHIIKLSLEWYTKGLEAARKHKEKEEKYYINPNTGSVDTLDGWYPATEKDGLIEVIKNENNEWVEKE